MCPFDFELEEFEVAEDPADLVPDYESALKYLGLGNTIIIVDRVEGERNPLTGPTKAFLELATIAAAWNKIDGFVPDFSNAGQYKYYPRFEYKKSAAGFVFAYTGCTAAAASFGSRLCFATRNRAKQFGKKFQDLYNQMFL